MLSEELTGLSAELTGLSAKLTGLSAKLTGLSAELTGLSAELTGLSAELTALSAEATVLSAELTALSEELAAFRIRHGPKHWQYHSGVPASTVTVAARKRTSWDRRARRQGGRVAATPASTRSEHEEIPFMKMFHVLVAAVVASAALGGVGYVVETTPARVSAPATIATGEPAPTPVAETPETQAESVVEGTVLEAIDVPSYTYYRIGASGPGGTWAAVPSAKLVVGDHARVEGAMKMVDFKSGRLNRVFPVIYFGTLHDGRSSPDRVAALRNDPDPHGGVDPHAAAAIPHAGYGDSSASGGNPHEGIQSAEPAVEVKRVARASGANGKTVAEVIGERKSSRKQSGPGPRYRREEPLRHPRPHLCTPARRHRRWRQGLR